MKRLLPVLVLVLACDPLAGPDYPGEPLLEITGTVENALTNPPPTEIALAWLVSDDEAEFAFHPEATTVPVQGDFPAGFTMSLYHPPPAGVLAAPVESELQGRIAIGFILALREGSSRDLTRLRAEDLLGVSDESVLVYAESAVDEFGLDAGYQLVNIQGGEGVDEANECYDGVFDDIFVCEDACFLASDACFEQCTDDRCFQTCDGEIDVCLGQCQGEFQPQLDECDQLANTVEAAQPDSLTVRMFDNASAEEIWGFFRPEDCELAQQQNLACVSSCDFDDAGCFAACEEDWDAFSCGPPLGYCEAVHTAWEQCIEVCYLAEGLCLDTCFGDPLCEEACFEEQIPCFDGCFEDFPIDTCEGEVPPPIEPPGGQP